MYYKVTLLDNSLDKSVAELVAYQNDDVVSIQVVSDNIKMKTHIEILLSKDAYILAPGKNSVRLYSDNVTHLYPNTIQYFQALPEILSWRGYNASFVNDTHKSVSWYEDDVFVLKSVEDNIYNNANGERIVKVVPTGYIAVNTDGRTVAAGRWLNANIDKEGADWSLVPNPYETMNSEQREEEKTYMEMGLQQYHPGADESLYEARKEENGDYYQAKEGYSPTGTNLQSHYAEVEENKEIPPQNLPIEVPPGKVLYAPDIGYALASEYWPPTQIPDYQKSDWYVFSDTGLTDEEKEAYAGMMGESPSLLRGLDKGVVQVSKTLDTSDGFKLQLPSLDNMTTVGANTGIVLNPLSLQKFPIDEMTNAEYKTKARIANKKLASIKALTSVRDPDTGELHVSPELDTMEIPDLDGLSATWRASFKGREYQKAGILALIEPTQYEVFGGPKGWHGHFLNWKYGLGKTSVVTGALAVLRNRGVIKSGSQTTIVTAPTKNIYIWQSEVGKFLGEYAVVIDGSKGTRVEQWENLLKQAQNNELPSMVIVGSSKFRFTRKDVPDDEDPWELDIDAQYMKLLAQGGRSGEREVKGNHIGVLTVDESGQYVNYDAARHHALTEIIDSVYNTKGLVWTLSGDISGNSATDTLSEMSFVNAYARSNYTTLAQEYTMTDRGAGREHKRMGRRIWKDYNRLRDFMGVFGSVIYPLSGKTVAGDNFGFVHTPDEGSPLGANWGAVYMQAERKLHQSAGLGQMNKALGLTSILINSSFGAVAPARLLEYDLGNNLLLSGVMKQLQPNDALKFKQEMHAYLAKVTTTKNSLGIGRLPNSDIDVLDRDKLFSKMFSQTSKDVMNSVLSSWDAVVLDNIVQSIDNEIKNHQGAGSPPVKMGVAGFSKRAINTLYRKLRDRYSADKVLINLIDGDTPPESVSKQQSLHQREKDRFVISLVTGAGLYGLSLPADRSWRFPTWNSAKAGQYEGRFHRKAEQHNVTTVTVPDGIVQYMRELEQRKSEMAREATHALIDANDDADELELKGVGSLTSFMDKLLQYRPRILERESEK